MAFRRIVNTFMWTKLTLNSLVGTRIQPITPKSGLKENFLVVKDRSENKNSTKVTDGQIETDGSNYESESFQCLWPFFVFARFLGLCPVNKEGNKLVITRRNPYWSFTVIALLVQVTMLAIVIRSFISEYKQKDSKSNDFLVRKFNDVIYYGHCLGNCLFMIANVGKLPEFLSACRHVESILKKYHKGNDKLVKHVMCAFLFFLVSQLVGNVLHYYSEVLKNNATSIETFFEEFYEIDPPNMYWGIFFCLAEIYCKLGWTFGDIVLTLFSLILTRYFLRLNKVINDRGQMETKFLDEIRSDHREITRLVDLCNRIFSPLFLLNYVGNIGYLLARLYIGVSEDFKAPTFWVKAEGAYAFSFQIMKIMFPTWVAAALNEQGLAALHYVHSWPSFINGENPQDNFRVLVIGRFVSQLVNNPVGISGCGYFLITKNFLVALISGLVTYEVVILQFQQSGIK